MPGKKRSSPQGQALAPGIGARVRLVSDRIGTRSKTAQIAGVSEDMIYRYIREQSPPSFSAIVALSRATGISMEWIATGERDPDRPDLPDRERANHDLDRLEEVIVKTRKKFEARRIKLDLEAEARVIRLVYDFYLDNADRMENEKLDRIIELAAFR